MQIWQIIQSLDINRNDILSFRSGENTREYDSSRDWDRAIYVTRSATFKEIVDCVNQFQILRDLPNKTGASYHSNGSIDTISYLFMKFDCNLYLRTYICEINTDLNVIMSKLRTPLCTLQVFVVQFQLKHLVRGAVYPTVLGGSRASSLFIFMLLFNFRNIMSYLWKIKKRLLFPLKNE